MFSLGGWRKGRGDCVRNIGHEHDFCQAQKAENTDPRTNYPLARNQYMNNSPGVFSCIRAGVNTGATCIRTEMKSLKNLANMRRMIPQKYFPVFARVRIQAPHAFAQKKIPQEVFPACIGFVPGGMR